MNKGFKYWAKCCIETTYGKYYVSNNIYIIENRIKMAKSINENYIEARVANFTNDGLCLIEISSIKGIYSV